MTDAVADTGPPIRSTDAEVDVERLFEVSYLAPDTQGRTILVLKHGTVSSGIRSSARAAGVYDLTERGTALKISFVLLIGGRHAAAPEDLLNDDPPSGNDPLRPIIVRVVLPLDATDSTLTAETSAGLVRLRMRRIWDFPKDARPRPELTPVPDTVPAK